MRLIHSIVAAALFSLAPLALADDKFGHEEITFEAAEFEDQRKFIIKEVRKGERYAEITPAQLEEVASALDRMGELFARRGSMDQMTEQERINLFNLQEQINTTLTAAAEDSRLICTREAPVGSRFKINNCKTVADRRLVREGSRDALRDYQTGQRAPAGGGG